MLQAFNNNQKLKDELIIQLENHYNADEIIKGQYWEHGKGCAIGCILHSNIHKDLEKIGIPEWLGYLIDHLFEGLSNNQSKKFPIKFIKSISVGFDNWILLYHKLCVYFLTDIIKTEKDKKVIKVIADIITLHIKVLKGDIKSNLLEKSAAWSTAESAAWSAAAWSAESAATVAASASATWSAKSAAKSAEWSAKSAAWSATKSATGSAEWAATGSATGSAAWLTAESAAIISISNKLLELLNEG